MAGVSECFNIGSVVACKTCYEKEIEGEVLAFDPQTKMLILSILYVWLFGGSLLLLYTVTSNSDGYQLTLAFRCS